MMITQPSNEPVCHYCGRPAGYGRISCQYCGAELFWDTWNTLIAKQKELMASVPHEVPTQVVLSMTAGMSLMEETMEYLNAIGRKPWRPIPLDKAHQLGELVDMLHFFLELIILNPNHVTWEEIVAGYYNKWRINMDRYARGKVGDYSWDKRAEQKEL